MKPFAKKQKKLMPVYELKHNKEMILNMSIFKIN